MMQILVRFTSLLDEQSCLLECDEGSDEKYTIV